jgi:excinuclease ABC subunit A
MQPTATVNDDGVAAPRALARDRARSTRNAGDGRANGRASRACGCYAARLVSPKGPTSLRDRAEYRPRADEPDFIVVRGAREHNLAIDELRIPKRSLVVFTGVSGSGKSSLAFDTLYAEGQRRYVESL